jgi:hypothetical protein
MTAINILRQKHAVHLISDGASYDEHQRLVSAGPKVFALPHINAAIGIRGPTVALPLMAHFVGHAASSFDGLKSQIVSVLKNAFGLCGTVLDRAWSGSNFEVVVGGISQRTGPDAYVVGCQGGEWSITDVPDIGFLPATPGTEFYFASKMLSKVSSTDDVDPSAFGIEVIEIQRGATSRVGSFAQLTSISSLGIETKIIRRWQDEIGRHLDGATLTSCSGVIGALSVNSLSIGDNAVIVPGVALLGAAVTGNGTGQTVLTKAVVIDTTGLAGKTISAIVQFVAGQGISSGTSSWSVSLAAGGTSFAGISGGGTFQPNLCVAGLYQFTANGTPSDGFTVTVGWAAPGNMVLSSGILTIASAKR